ncbi:MAG: pyruvate kinase [Bacillota bacterium]|nr:pyruvate kinase [Bacillota bacterium]
MAKESIRTKIVCTIGPASEDRETLSRMIDEGMGVCRLNFSHGTHEEHRKRIETIKEVRKEKGAPIAILLDTRGPEIRTGDFEAKDILLEIGQDFTITMDDVVGNKERCTVTYKELVNDVSVGNRILIDDGLIEMHVKEVTEKEIKCTVVNSGFINNRKGINIPGVRTNLPAVTDKDKSDIIFGIENDIDFIAASFVRRVSDIIEIKEVLESNGGEKIKIIAKIENQEGLDNIAEILGVADGVMIARGDLGVEVQTERMPMLQKELINTCNKASKPVITATQMLDSMMRNPRPTRAEVTDVANAVLDGTDAIMLSGETAAGKYPVQSVETMRKIAYATESTIDFDYNLHNKRHDRQITITNAISHATCITASELKAKAIVTATARGYTARMVSSYRPSAPIIASTSDDRAYTQMNLLWGVIPIKGPEVTDTEELLRSAVDEAILNGHVAEGDLVVITAGVPVGKAGNTNLVRVHTVMKIITQGIGVGNSKFSGRAQVVDAETTPQMFREGNILVASATSKDMMKMVVKASAVVIESDEITSDITIVGLNLGIPVIVGAKDAAKLIKNGETVTVDAEFGRVYAGEIKML